MGLPEMFQHAFNYVQKFGETLQEITCGIHLINLLSSISKLSSCTDLKSKTGDVALSFLKKKWKEESKKGDLNVALADLINLCFVHSADVQSLIELFFSTAITEFLESDDSSETFPTLNKGTFPTFYKLLLHYLHEHSRTIIPGNIHTHQDENLEKLLNWSALVKIFVALINLIKNFDSRGNLMAALKYGRRFVDCFMRQGMPTLDLLLTSHKDDIQALFKTLQLSTRFLHHLCSHTKIKKDVTLINQVPQLKCTLESLIHRVKDMLNKNKCVGAFWLGNLKNRDLRGDEMSSQSTQSSAKSDEEEDDGAGAGNRGRIATSGGDEDNDDDPMIDVNDGEEEIVCYDSDELI